MTAPRLAAAVSTSASAHRSDEPAAASTTESPGRQPQSREPVVHHRGQDGVGSEVVADGDVRMAAGRDVVGMSART